MTWAEPEVKMYMIFSGFFFIKTVNTPIKHSRYEDSLKIQEKIIAEKLTWTEPEVKMYMIFSVFDQNC